MSGPSLLVSNISNPFWKDLLLSWASFCEILKLIIYKKILDSPILYNSKLSRGRYFYIKNWFEKGGRLISDLIDENGNLYQFERFKEIYGVRGTYLEYMYHALLTKIPDLWKTVINYNKPYCILNAYSTSCNVYVGTLLQDEKGCRRLYDIMIQATDNTIQNKWERNFGNISQHELQKYNSMIKD